MRYLRLLLGTAIIVVVLWIIVGEQMSGASANAFINTRLTTVRAPVAGQLALPDRGLGSAVQSGEEIGTITDPLVDVIRLNDLAMEQSFASAELAAARAQLETTQQAIAPLEDRLAAFSTARVSELEVRLAHARARLAMLEGDIPPDAELTDLAAGADAGEGRDPRLPGLAIEYAKERVAALEIALDVARRGVFLGDGYNDAPYSEQRRIELAGQQDVLAASVDLAAARLAAIGTRLQQEQVRTSRLGGGPLRSPVNGLIWEVLAGNGETVQRGQDVVRIADCDAAIVSVSVSENVYNTLRIGDDAVFRLSGANQTYPATILRLAGSGALTIYQNLTVAPSLSHLERYDVTLLVPELRSDPDLRCLIGRTGRVFFDRRPLDTLRSFWR